MKRKFLAGGILAMAFVAGSFVGSTGITTVEAQEALDSDYQVCMDYCMPEHNFDYCHGKCEKLATPESI